MIVVICDVSEVTNLNPEIRYGQTLGYESREGFINLLLSTLYEVGIRCHINLGSHVS